MEVRKHKTSTSKRRPILLTCPDEVARRLRTYLSVHPRIAAPEVEAFFLASQPSPRTTRRKRMRRDPDAANASAGMQALVDVSRAPFFIGLYGTGQLQYSVPEVIS